MNKKNVSLWVLYDFGYSLLTVVFFLYFSQWLVIDNHVTDFWYNMIFAGSTFLLVITAPFTGSYIDRTGKRLKALRIITGSAIGCFLLLSLYVLNVPTGYIIAAWLFLLANYFYQFSYSVYNPLLTEIAPVERRGIISGIGNMSDWIGQIIGIVITLPFAMGYITIFGKTGRSQTFFPATLIFIACTIPLLIWYKEKVKPIQPVTPTNTTFREFWKTPYIGRFLIAFFFFNDAVLTASNNFSIYLAQVFHATDTVKSVVLILILLSSAIGALASGWVTDRIGVKPSMMIILIGWIFLFPALSLINNIVVFSCLSAIMGIWFGSIWTVGRAMVIHLVPEHQINQAFSFYAIAERFSSFSGPLSWGLIVTILINLGAIRYRIALSSMTIFVIIGLALLWSIPSTIKKPRADTRG